MIYKNRKKRDKKRPFLHVKRVDAKTNILINLRVIDHTTFKFSLTSVSDKLIDKVLFYLFILILIEDTFKMENSIDFESEYRNFRNDITNAKTFAVFCEKKAENRSQNYL